MKNMTTPFHAARNIPVCAFRTRLRMNKRLFQMLPRVTLLALSVTLAFINYRLLKGRWRLHAAGGLLRPPHHGRQIDIESSDGNLWA